MLQDSRAAIEILKTGIISRRGIGEEPEIKASRIKYSRIPGLFTQDVHYLISVRVGRRGYGI